MKDKTPFDDFFESYISCDSSRRLEYIKKMAYLQRRITRVNNSILHGTIIVTMEHILKTCGWERFCYVTDTDNDFDMEFWGKKEFEVDKIEAAVLKLL